MATPNYTVNYDDERFKQVEADKQVAMDQMNQTYEGMANASDQFYQQQIDAAKDYAETQKQNQQAQTDLIVEQQNQQKDKANKDYLKEQSGAYVDWQKQSNKYGANAEQMAAQGLQSTGFSESSQVSMYNTYQNRVATARESYNTAVLNYDNAIKDAQLQNNSKLAEIAYQSFQAQLDLALEGFQYKNDLLIDKMDKQMEIDKMYDERWQNVLAQMNKDNALAEAVRQFNESQAMEQKRLNEEIRQFNEAHELQERQFAEEKRQFDVEIARLKAKDTQEARAEAERLELERGKLIEEKRQADRNYELGKAQLAEEKRQFNNKNSGSSGGSSGGKSGGKYQFSETSVDSEATLQSILDLGQGPISAEYLAQQVASGLVKETKDENGNTTFEYTKTGLGASLLPKNWLKG